MKSVKRVGVTVSVLVATICSPLIIWWINIAGFWRLVANWQTKRARLAQLVCSTNADCPSGHVCVGGRCIRQFGL